MKKAIAAMSMTALLMAVSTSSNAFDWVNKDKYVRLQQSQTSKVVSNVPAPPVSNPNQPPQEREHPPVIVVASAPVKTEVPPIPRTEPEKPQLGGGDKLGGSNSVPEIDAAGAALALALLGGIVAISRERRKKQ